MNRVSGVTKQDGSACIKKSSALGTKGKKTFPLIEYELLKSEEYEDCAWCQAQCDAEPQDCVGAWGEWGDCSATCGVGVAVRYYQITQGEYSGGALCPYKKYEEDTSACTTGVMVNGVLKCPIACEGDWTDWTSCSATCGGGTQTRTFTLTVAAQYGGNTCDDIYRTENAVKVGDKYTELNECADTYCPTDCVGEWSSYTECSVTCGALDNLFTATRTYEILTPARLGGDDCPEYDGTVESALGVCNTEQCAVDVTLWLDVDDPSIEYMIVDESSSWTTDAGYVIGSIDFYNVDPAILYNEDGDIVAEVHMAQVTNNNVETKGVRNKIDNNEAELDDMYDQFDNMMVLDESNEIKGLHNIILGGYSNDIERDTLYSVIGGGKHNQIIEASENSAVGGGLNNVINAAYASVLGGWKNKCYSNYCTITGGYLNQVSARFGTVLGGSKNTVSGRYGVAAGFAAVTKGDFSAAFGFTDTKTTCLNTDTSSVMFCTEKFVVNDFDVVSLFSNRRRALLREDKEEEEKEGEDVEKKEESEKQQRQQAEEEEADAAEHAERTSECADRLEVAEQVNRRLKDLMATLDAL